ncbi:MAG: hypothetical protein NVSMB45_13060 [Ginsengibacter sp.]
MKNIRAAYLSIFLIIFYTNHVEAQCTALGQNPSTAFPVCGEQSFTQNTVPLCGGRIIPGPCTDGGETDINPFWYKFTCYQTGSLGFVITPFNLGDDYDWQLFDVTNHLPDEVFTNKSLFVSCNWSGNPGQTGTASNGNGNVNCGGFRYPTFSFMPLIQQGHNYLLLISHFTNSQSGYTLAFGGGNAVITDTTKADFQKVYPNCDATKLTVLFNKKLKCASLDGDGSDFKINNGIITGAVGGVCQTSFDLDSIVITFSAPLAPGSYTLSVQNGNDGNTLLDICQTPMDIGRSINFVVPPITPPPVDTINLSKCPPDSIFVTFNKVVVCNSVDPDGSDFQITGPQPVSISNISSVCDANGGSFTFKIKLINPISVPGTYTLKLKKGNDGNSVIGLCTGEAIPASKDFVVPIAVSANFSATSNLNCLSDTLTFTNNGGATINSWKWTANGFGFGSTSKVVKYFPSDSTYNVVLKVSNGGCNDQHDTTFTVQKLKALFSVPSAGCPNDTIPVINLSRGPITNYLWDFGNGIASILKDPPTAVYVQKLREQSYSILLRVSNGACSDSVQHDIRILSSCNIILPNSFSPNNDGRNDFFYPLNALKADNLNFSVYNRWGVRVFYSTDWNKRWDGTFKGQPQDPGIYTWILIYIDRDTKKAIKTKGTVMLMR